MKAKNINPLPYSVGNSPSKTGSGVRATFKSFLYFSDYAALDS